MTAAAIPLVPVSWGELLDKITILEIKQARIVDPAALRNVERELHLLSKVAAGGPLAVIAAPLARLKAINEQLWEIEDAIRTCEARGSFGPEFIDLARAVYKTNDERAAIKRQLNALLGSQLVEEKSYADTSAASAPEAASERPLAGA